MDKTLIEYFTPRIKDGKLIIEQKASNISIVIQTILDDVADDVSTEEYDILKQAINILNRYK